MTEPTRNTSSNTAGPGAWTPIPMSRGRWFYTTGQEDYPRGVYQAANGSFEWRAPLAHVVGQIPGQRGTEGIICADPAPESPRVIVGHGLIKDGSWANMLGLPLSDDRAVMNAASSALRILISEAKLVPPAPWIGEDGQLCAPDETGCLAAGYLATSDAEPGMALDGWRAVAGLLGPEMAFVLGLAAVAPYLKAAGHRSLVCELYGDPGQGKTTTLALAAALWGDPAGVMVSFNSTARGMERHLGQLGVLPGVADETGMAAFTPDEWRRFLFGVGEGDQRLTARYRDPSGTSRSARWDSVFFMSGNGQVTDGLATGVHAGLRRRVVSIPAPFTTAPEQAEALTGAGNDPGLLASCYGHLGAAIRGRYTVADVRQFYDEAAGLLGPLSNEPVARDLGKYMRLGVAGVLMIGGLLGTGDGPRDAAVTFARGYLAEHGHAPEHDADRFIAAVLDFAAREGSRWPTETGYSREDQRDPARGVAGVWADDRSRLWVFTATFRELCQAEGLDRVMVCRELARRALLGVPKQTRSSDKRWQKRKRLGGGNPWVYEIDGAAFGDEDQADEATPATDPGPAPAAPPTAPERPEPQRMTWGEGPTIGDEYGAQPEPAPAAPAPRRPAGGRSASQARQTLSRMAPDTRACSSCGQAMTVVEPGQATHPGCEPAPAPAARPARRAAQPQDETLRAFMADARRRRAFKGPRAEAQYAALTHRLGVLDSTAGLPEDANWPGLRILGALEGGRDSQGQERPGPFAPLAGKNGRQPYFAPFSKDDDPAIPGVSEVRNVIEAAVPLSGWNYRREGYTGDVVMLDVSGAYISATSSVEVAHGALSHTGPMDDRQAGRRPGFYLVAVQRWDEAGMPSPLPGTPGDLVWIGAPRMSLLRELADAGRWPDGGALDSWTGERCRLDDWAHLQQELRRYAVGRYGRDSDQYPHVKDECGLARSLMRGSWPAGEGTSRVWHCKAQRPDWALHIEEQSGVTLWRTADKCRRACPPELGPVAIAETDALTIPAAALGIVTAAPAGGGRPPVRIDPDGIEFGTLKIKARGTWEG